MGWVWVTHDRACCESGNERSVTIKTREYLLGLGELLILHKDSAVLEGNYCKSDVCLFCTS